jgi:hypothetical protein
MTLLCSINKPPRAHSSDLVPWTGLGAIQYERKHFTPLFHTGTVGPAGATGVSPVVSILFLAAGPTHASRLRLGEELREIQEKL